MASVALAPNLSRSTGGLSEQMIQSELPFLSQTITRSASVHTRRSRRPISVDDIPFVEDFLSRTTLYDVHGSSVGDSGVFSPSPHSSNSTFSFNEYAESSVSELSFENGSVPVTSTPYKQEMLYSYPEESIPSPFCMDTLFREIYEDIGACWKKLGRHLLVGRECVLNNIDADFTDVREKAFQMLSRWKQEKGQQHATPKLLFEAVVHIQRTDVAEKMLKLQVPSLLPLAHLLDSIIPSGCKLYNTKEVPESFDVKKVLNRNEKVFVCSSKETAHRFVVKKLEDEKNVFAVRKCIDNKALRQQKHRLRNTQDFIRDLQIKQEMVQSLLNIIQDLQTHLHTEHQAICQTKLSCSNCGQYRTQKDIIQNDLTLLHYELQKMVRGNRRISFSGIPSERIYQLARRTYAVCEKHKRMHKGRRASRRSVCSIASEEETDSDDDGDILEGPLVCVANIIFSMAKRRSTRTHKVSRSAKTRQTSRPNTVKRNKSDNGRQSYVLAQENPVAMPSCFAPRDWSGVPAFKLYSDIKSVSSKDDTSKQCDKHKLMPKQFAPEMDEDYSDFELGEVFI